MRERTNRAASPRRERGGKGGGKGRERGRGFTTATIILNIAGTEDDNNAAVRVLPLHTPIPGPASNVTRASPEKGQ